MATEPKPIPPTVIPHQISEDAYIALRKLEYDHSLARLGLQGTLWGALVSLLTILVIVLMPLFSEAVVVQRWEVVGVVAVFVIPITAYGAFIFDRAMKISGTVSKEGTTVQASVDRSPETSRPNDV